MTRFRFVSLCLAALLFLSLAAPAMAYPPLITPSGIVETINEAIGHIRAWFDAGLEILRS